MAHATTTLHTGETVPEALLNTTMILIRRSLLTRENGAVALFDLVRLAYNPEAMALSASVTELERLALMADGRLHDDVALIVRAGFAVTENDRIEFRNPVTGEPLGSINPLA